MCGDSYDKKQYDEPESGDLKNIEDTNHVKANRQQSVEAAPQVSGVFLWITQQSANLLISINLKIK